MAERGVKSLFGGSKRTGRNFYVNPAASSDFQRESRAAHLTAKATSARQRVRIARRVSPGYGGRHVRTVRFGTGETRLPGLRRAKTARISRW